MKRTGFSTTTKKMKQGAFIKGKVAAKMSLKPDQRPKKMKTAQRPKTAEDEAFWDRLAKEVGCVACLKDGNFNPHVSIHHIDGRTKPGCHSLVLPLCGPHHQQDDTDPAGRVAVHPYKARFERKYGTQEELLAQCHAFLDLELPFI